MAFPTTPLLDSFTRADGGLGSAWTSPVEPGDQTPVIFTNAVSTTASLYGSAYWNAGTVGPDSECYMTIPAGVTLFENARCLLRAQNLGTGTACMYRVRFDHGAGNIQISRMYNNVASAVLATIAVDPLAGWKIGAAVKNVGADIQVEAWADSGGGWAQQGSTYVDTGAIASFPNLANDGFIAFKFYGAGAADLRRQIDDFGGGTIIVPSAGGQRKMTLLGTG